MDISKHLTLRQSEQLFAGGIAIAWIDFDDDYNPTFIEFEGYKWPDPDCMNMLARSYNSYCDSVEDLIHWLKYCIEDDHMPAEVRTNCATVLHYINRG